MDPLMIHEDGTLTQRDKPLKGSVLSSLSGPVTLGPGTCLYSFFRMLDRYPVLTQISEMLPALARICQKAAPGQTTPELERLLFYKTVEITGFPGPASLNIYHSLRGEAGGEIRELKFFHLETLLDLPLGLGRLNHIVFGDTEDSLQFDTHYTLFELVEGIAWELSFNFNPLECSIRR